MVTSSSAVATSSGESAVASVNVSSLPFFRQAGFSLVVDVEVVSCVEDLVGELEGASNFQPPRSRISVARSLYSTKSTSGLIDVASSPLVMRALGGIGLSRIVAYPPRTESTIFCLSMTASSAERTAGSAKTGAWSWLRKTPNIRGRDARIMLALRFKRVSSEGDMPAKPVGSGPYQIKEVTTEKTGSVTRYELVPFKNFTLGTPYLKKLTFLFFPNEDALIDAWNSGRIDSFAGISPSELTRLNRNANIIRASLPRIFGVFLNQDHAPVLADPAVRSALDAVIDKQKIVDSVLGGYATILDSPIPPSALITKGDEATSMSPEVDFVEYKERATDILERGGWKFEAPSKSPTKASTQEGTSTSTTKENPAWRKKGKELTFTLATADSPELVATAEELVTMWKAAGINVDLHVYPLSELNTNIIRPRAYDALLFGEVVGRTLDLFAFWHSSQRNDPGLNLAMYTNARADSFLAQARTTTNRKERETLYRSFVEIIKKEKPAVFLYAPQLIYVLPETILGTEFGVLATSAERFLNVYEWYTSTERVWSVFTSVSE